MPLSPPADPQHPRAAGAAGAAGAPATGRLLPLPIRCTPIGLRVVTPTARVLWAVAVEDTHDKKENDVKRKARV